MPWSRCWWLVCALAGACSSASDPARPATPLPASDSDGGAQSGALCSSCGACEEMLPVTSAMHVTGPIDYPDPPPVGGPHHSCWGTWGVHTDVLEAERWVHNLEHGGIVYLDHCPDGCAAEITELSALVGSQPRTLLTSYALLPKRFAAVAWGYRLVSDCFDRAAFERFYAAHFDHGRESIADDPPADCEAFPDL